MKIPVGGGCHHIDKFNRINKFFSEIYIKGAVATAPYGIDNV